MKLAMTKAVAPITGGISVPPVEAQVSTPAAKVPRMPIRRMAGMVITPVVSTLVMTLPLIEPISPDEKIATLAEAYHVPLAPHCTATFLGIAASLHVVSSVPFLLIHEFYPQNAGFNVPGLTKMEFALDEDGYIGLPPGPGLGVEVNEKLLEQEASKPQTYKWPGAKLKDGSIADY